MAVIIQLVSGAPGGNLAGSRFQKISPRTVLNSMQGIVGRGLGGQLLGLFGLAGASGGTDLTGIISSLVGGGFGSGILMASIGPSRGS